MFAYAIVFQTLGRDIFAGVFQDNERTVRRGARQLAEKLAGKPSRANARKLELLRRHRRQVSITTMEQTPRSNTIRVLAIDPTVTGFRFAVLERPDRVVDWGVKAVNRPRQEHGCVKWMAHFINLYRPNRVVVENHGRKGLAALPSGERADRWYSKPGVEQKDQNCFALAERGAAQGQTSPPRLSITGSEIGGQTGCSPYFAL